MNSNHPLNLVDLLVPLFDPVIQAVDDPENGKALLNDLGYLPPSQVNFLNEFSAPLKSIAKIIHDKELEIESGSDLDALKIYLEILETIAGIINALNNIGLAISTNFSPEFISQTGILDKFPRQLTDYLVSGMVAKRFPTLQAVLLAIGIFDLNYISETPTVFNTPYWEKKVNWNKIGGSLTDTLKQVKEHYKWDQGDIDFARLIRNLRLLGNTLNLDTELSNPFPDSLSVVNGGVDVVTDVNAPNLDILKFPLLPNDSDIIGLQLYPVLDSASKQKIEGFGLGFYFDPTQGLTYEIAQRIFLKINYSGDRVDTGIVFRKGVPAALVSNMFGSGSTDSNIVGFSPEFSYENKPEEHILIFDTSFGATLDFNSWSCKIGVKEDHDFFIETAIKQGRFSFNSASADGLIKKLLPAGSMKADFDLIIGFSGNHGLYFGGSSSLELQLPVHINLGPVALEKLILSIKPNAEKIPLSVGTNIKASLGSVTIIINNFGAVANISFPPSNAGNLGPVQLGLEFKPPEGAGIYIDAGGIKGGGILKFDPADKEYFGALELEFRDMFSLKAYGIINTKMPDGTEGFSMLIVITAEFTPVQLGFGFTLNGVGGLLGLNRTVKLDVLREGIKTNVLKSILFPENVVANINRIVSDIKQVFPPQEDRMLIAPMGKIGWGTPAIITLEIGLLIEIPVPRVAILGVLKALLPEEDKALLKLQINFLGVIDFENRSISFNASLYDSRLLTYTLTGDMAFRLMWGEKSLFILTVGGFHPSFKEIPGDLRNLRRITISLLNGGIARITVQTYFAITSNTAQFGAKAELLAGNEDGFNIYGFISYDVLFQFDPFKFIADFSAGVALRRRTSVYMGIHVSGQLSGPTPWDARGEASVDFFFFSISVSFHETWGNQVNAGDPQTADLLDLLRKEIENNSNWKAVIPTYKSLHVSIKQIRQAADKITIHPFGILTFSERLVPLDIAIDKFGNRLPKDARQFAIDATNPSLTTEDVKEQFAPANFFALKDEEKLTRPSFEEMNSGFRIKSSVELQLPNQAETKDVDYEFSYLRKKRASLQLRGRYMFQKSLFKASAKAGSIAKSTLSFATNRVSTNAPEPVLVRTEQFAVARRSDMRLHTEGLVAGSYTEALQLYNQLVIERPELKEQLQIISDFELNVN